MITTVIIEDVEFVRKGIAEIINSADGFKCIAAFEDCESMLEQIEDLLPDVIITDIGLPGISGIEGIKEVKKILPNQTIVVLTVHEENDKIFEAIMAGASGYLPKKTPPNELIQAIKEAYDGGSPMNSEIAGKVINLLRTIAPKKEEEIIAFFEWDRRHHGTGIHRSANRSRADSFFRPVRFHARRGGSRTVARSLPPGSGLCWPLECRQILASERAHGP